MTSEQDGEVGYDIPAVVGMAVLDIQTPALIVDLDAMERNLVRMRDAASAMGVRLRAHAKTHKSADIARLQMVLGGACGICCQKVSEAEAMVRGGITDILITNEVRDLRKIDRLAKLADKARIIVCVDDTDAVVALSDAAVRHGVQIEILVEIDCGAGRCGVAPGLPAVELCRRVAATAGLIFSGLQAYHGPAQHIVDPIERAAAIAGATRLTADTVDRLKGHGLACRIVGGAGTGSFPFEGRSGVYNEIQCGSYVFMDADYGRILAEGGGRVGGFENALFVLTGIMSVSHPRRPVCDAGLKALAMDSGLPIVFDSEGVSYVAASDEHGVLIDARKTLSANDKVRLVPGHCDPTCNLYDCYVATRNGKVEALWSVIARGKLY